MRANLDYEYVHECGGIAFKLDHMPVMGEVRRAVHAQHTDGRPMEPYSVVRCDACGAMVGRIKRGNIRHERQR